MSVEFRTLGTRWGVIRSLADTPLFVDSRASRFRYKSIIGDGLRARTPGGRQTETLLACNVLNRMTELGRPASYSIGR